MRPFLPSGLQETAQGVGRTEKTHKFSILFLNKRLLGETLLVQVAVLNQITFLEGRCGGDDLAGPLPRAAFRRRPNDWVIGEIMERATQGLLIAALFTSGCAADAGGPGGEEGVTGSGSSGSVTTGTGSTGNDGAGGSTAGTGTGGAVVTGTGGAVVTGTGGAVVTGTGGSIDDPPPPPPTECVPGVPNTSAIPRLTNRQYDNVMNELLGVTGVAANNGNAPSAYLPTQQNGSINEVDWASYQAAAEAIASEVMASDALRANFIACDPAAAGCMESTISEFGRKAFRRPLSADEQARFETLIATGATLEAPADEVAQYILNAMLVSPSFLQRSEIDETPAATGDYALSQYEIASRMSFMLWDSMPDDVLSAAADAGELVSKEQILAQAVRMLDDPRARPAVADFHEQYMHMQQGTRWHDVTHDAAAFPAFTDTLVPSAIEETKRFFDHIVFDSGGSFADLLTSPVGFVNASNAAVYGLDPAQYGEEFVQVDLDAATRPGILTRAGFLNANSAYDRSHPILRGAFITKEVLGVELDPPPAGAAQTELPEGADLDTNRKQVEEQTGGGACANCHEVFVNPPGFVLENYDAMGVWQTTERTSGAAIDPNANVFIDGVSVPTGSALELMSNIANSYDANHFYAEKWVSFGYQRNYTAEDLCYIDELTDRMVAGGYTVKNLITDLTQSDYFTVRKVER